MSRQSRQGRMNALHWRKEVQKAQLGDNIANHMAYIFMEILYDKFGLSFRQLKNFYDRVIERRKKWQNDDDQELTTTAMLEYCQKRNIKVVEWVKNIPMSHKLYMADLGKNRAVLGADRNIESALVATMLLTIPVLKQSYKFKNSDIHEFMRWCEYFIDSYWRKQPGCKDHYLNDEMIRQLFIEEEHWDLLKGCAV